MFVFLALLAAFTHVLFFVLESLLWGNHKINKVFQLTEEQAQQTKLLAFNQGFYNLFLSLGIFVGLFLNFQGEKTVGYTLIIFAFASMFAASLVLYGSNKSLWRGALIQGLPPLLGILTYYFL